MHRWSVVVSASLLTFLVLLLSAHSFAQEKWLTDEDARERAEATVRAVSPEPCYNTYRRETLENWIMSERRERIAGQKLNRIVYVYEVDADACDFVVVKNGQPELGTMLNIHGADYGVVAVDRQTGDCYWFDWSDKRAEVFKRLVADQRLVLDRTHPTPFFALYSALVLGPSEANEITGLGQLRRLAADNFLSAYSPYEQDEKWESKFDEWWRKCRARLKRVKLETTTEPASDGVIIRGYSFRGFELRIPRIDPPPKGTPTLSRWSVLLKADGTVEKLQSTVVFASR